MPVGVCRNDRKPCRMPMPVAFGNFCGLNGRHFLVRSINRAGRDTPAEQEHGTAYSVQRNLMLFIHPVSR